MNTNTQAKKQLEEFIFEDFTRLMAKCSKEVFRDMERSGYFFVPSLYYMMLKDKWLNYVILN